MNNKNELTKGKAFVDSLRINMPMKVTEKGTEKIILVFQVTMFQQTAKLHCSHIHPHTQLTIPLFLTKCKRSKSKLTKNLIKVVRIQFTGQNIHFHSPGVHTPLQGSFSNGDDNAPKQ